VVLAANLLSCGVEGFAIARAHRYSTALSGESFGGGPADPLAGRATMATRFLSPVSMIGLPFWIVFAGRL